MQAKATVPRAGFLRHVFLRLMSRLVKLIGENMLTLSCILTSTSELDFPLHFNFMLNTATSRRHRKKVKMA